MSQSGLLCGISGLDNNFTPNLSVFCPNWNGVRGFIYLKPDFSITTQYIKACKIYLNQIEIKNIRTYIHVSNVKSIFATKKLFLGQLVQNESVEIEIHGKKHQVYLFLLGVSNDNA